jgi:hypothetical protein
MYRNQRGRGMPVFVGPYSQRGHGLGGILGSMGKMAMPLLKQVGKHAAKLALSTGANLLGDVFQGRNFKDSLKARGGEAVKNTGLHALRVAHRAISGSPRQTTARVTPTTRRRRRPTQKRRGAPRAARRRAPATTAHRSRKRPSASRTVNRGGKRAKSIGFGDIFD